MTESNNTTTFEGATPSEQLLESARRNNFELLQEIVDSKSSTPKELLQLIETTVDGVGNNALQLTAVFGSFEVMDLLLDTIHDCVHEVYADSEESKEAEAKEEAKIGELLNKRNKLDGNTVLHLAVQNAIKSNEPEFGEFIVVEVLLKCAPILDVSIKNSLGEKAVDLITDELIEKAEDSDKELWEKIRMELLGAEFSFGLDVQEVAAAAEEEEAGEADEGEASPDEDDE
ncbi:hypothetical protein WICPIJ_008997 [Wickerhamomyces pijperi]|uniref:Uncharacterized protein n=1 Tax=Wickerhamomyces pijperi TaxID=599730 RepID=A0A9P8PS29_WICPI|nr:hypothetical protein WICPIJ_008997 [Wickerhamomyces pijperi]